MLEEKQQINNKKNMEFPGRPGVKTHVSSAGVMGSIPSREVRSTSHTTWPKKKKIE